MSISEYSNTWLGGQIITILKFSKGGSQKSIKLIGTGRGEEEVAGHQNNYFMNYIDYNVRASSGA